MKSMAKEILEENLENVHYNIDSIDKIKECLNKLIEKMKECYSTAKEAYENITRYSRSIYLKIYRIFKSVFKERYQTEGKYYVLSLGKKCKNGTVEEFEKFYRND